MNSRSDIEAVGHRVIHVGPDCEDPPVSEQPILNVIDCKRFFQQRILLQMPGFSALMQLATGL